MAWQDYSSCPSSAFHSAAQSPPSSIAPTAGSRASDSDSSISRRLDPVSLAARVRSCDVYLALRGRDPSLLRFGRWLRAELEIQGISCFVSDRGGGRLSRSAVESAAFGVVIVTRKSFSNPYSMEEVRVFSERRKLVPIFFKLSKCECNVRDIVERRGELWERYGGELWSLYGGLEEEWMEAVKGLSRVVVKLEVSASNYKDCIFEVVSLLGMGLGRRGIMEKVTRCKELAAEEEFPFPRNNNFIGRKKELAELELLLFGDIESVETGTQGMRRNDFDASRNSRSNNKGKDPMMSMDPDDNIGINRLSMREKPYGVTHTRKGVACVSGESGIGKTELLLEFAYKFAQRYRAVLWVGGEGKYIRENYMDLRPRLGLDVITESDLCPDRNGQMSFQDIEQEAIRKVRKELMRDIPFLLVIDNLESEKDWWDGRNIMELLPRFGGETHMLISTRLPRIMNIEPFRLHYLSSSEAMLLMKGTLSDVRVEEADALRLIEEKLGRLPLGLAIVGAILSELPLNPPKLLDAVNRMPYREISWSNKEDIVLKHNPFLVQLLDLCFSIFDHAEKPWKTATRMVMASGWFAPAPIPVSMLALAANEAPVECHGSRFWKKCTCMLSCMRMASNPKTSEDEGEASSMLVRFCIARRCSKTGYISFHDIIKLYARKRGNIGIARGLVQAINFEGFIPQHKMHVWASCFLLFKFHRDAAIVDILVPELLSFIKRFVLPLALHSFWEVSRCSASLELLRLATEALEVHEKSFLYEAKNAKEDSSTRSAIKSNPLLYQDFALLRATLLETRAKLMIRGGLFDIGEQLCRTSVSIKEVMYGWEHQETMSTRETMEQLLRFRSNF